MALTLAQLFGGAATRSGSQLTIDFSSTFFSKLSNPSSATPSQLVAALLDVWYETLQDFADDETAGVAVQAFGANVPTILTRGTDSIQIQTSFTINCYQPYGLEGFDPDNVL